MNFDLPLEQLVRHRGARFQLGFATEAKLRLPASDDFALSASRLGLHVLARNEDGLGAAAAVLHAAYPSTLEVGPPMVRLIQGVHVQEPIMHVRINLQASDEEAVKRALALRGATLQEEQERARRTVLRYEAPLARLLGFPAQLGRLTSGTARHWIVLSHYALVADRPERDGGGDSIIVTQADAANLGMLQLNEALKCELERAVLVSSEKVPPDVATMNSLVRYTDELEGASKTVALVYPPVARRAQGVVSVLAPIGSALIGLSEGQTIEWGFPDGSRRRIRLEEVLHQPERNSNIPLPKTGASSVKHEQI
jgi:regulator of nucleoside diphosphate kinase